jgi:hypothetical protein
MLHTERQPMQVGVFVFARQTPCVGPIRYKATSHSVRHEFHFDFTPCRSAGDLSPSVARNAGAVSSGFPQPPTAVRVAPSPSFKSLAVPSPPVAPTIYSAQPPYPSTRPLDFRHLGKRENRGRFGRQASALPQSNFIPLINNSRKATISVRFTSSRISR